MLFAEGRYAVTFAARRLKGKIEKINLQPCSSKIAKTLTSTLQRQNCIFHFFSGFMLRTFHCILLQWKISILRFST